MDNLNFNIKEVVIFYEERITLKSMSYDDYINAILLYWSISFDYGLESYCISQNIISNEKLLELPDIVKKLFDESLAKFPNDIELKFWRLYIDEQNSYSEGKNKKEIVDLLKSNNFILPHFYMYVQFNIIEKKQLVALKKALFKEKDNYKKYYILSYLDNIPFLE
jgi:hypothetical protein